MSSLDAPFCRRCVGADAVDVEFVTSAPELRVTVGASGGYMIYAENACFVTVERQRLTVLFDISARPQSIQTSDSVPLNNICIRRLVASSMNTSAVHTGPRSSIHGCSQPSIWTSSPTHARLISRFERLTFFESPRLWPGCGRGMVTVHSQRRQQSSTA
jgi:hypothetical protein